MVNHLAELKRNGLPIFNSAAEFAAMKGYFRDPGTCGKAVQAQHGAGGERTAAPGARATCKLIRTETC